MRLELYRPGDAGWESSVGETPRDVYHTAGFHAYAQASGEGAALLAVVGDGRRGLAWPYLLRPVAEVPGLEGSEATDVTSVYGYPGPIAWGCRPGDAFIGDAWQSLLGLWRDQRAIAVFTRFHPLLANASLVSGLHGSWIHEEQLGSVSQIGLTVSIDCTLDDEAMREEYDHGVRRGIAACRKAGFATVDDESWSELPAFCRLYRETMDRNRAAAYYYFDHANIERLRAALDGHAHLLVTRSAGDVVAAGIITEFGGIAQSYLAASDVTLRPSPRLLFNDDARRWARDRGDCVLHLGGGRGARDDSLLQFKARFSSRRHPFHVGRWVLDWEKYHRLTEERLAGPLHAVHVDPAYFPAYRAPVDGAAGAPDEARIGAAVTAGA